MAVDLADVFRHYAAPNGGMDIRAFIKSLKDSDLLDGHYTKVDADLAFARCAAKGSRRLGLEDWVQILRSVARRRDVADEDVFRKARAAVPGVGDGSSREEPRPATAGPGPERFFYDTKTYTGIHKYGSGSPSPERQRRTSPRRAVARSPSPRGPERFFYDKTTYTGTHRHGGPSASGNGLPKEGYKDLCEVGLRVDAPAPRPARRPRKEPSPPPPAEPSPPLPAEEGRSASPVPLPILLGTFNRSCDVKSFLQRDANSEVRGLLNEEDPTREARNLLREDAKSDLMRLRERAKRKLASKTPTTLGIGTRFIPVAPPMPSISLDLSVDSNPSSLLDLSD